jgi:hypothetical protein
MALLGLGLAFPVAATEMVHCSTIPLVLTPDMKASPFLECYRRPNKTGRVRHEIVQYAAPEGVSMVIYSHMLGDTYIEQLGTVRETLRAVAPELERGGKNWSVDSALHTGIGTAKYARFEAYNGQCVAAVQLLRRRGLGIAEMLTLARCSFDNVPVSEAQLRAFIDAQQLR